MQLGRFLVEAVVLGKQSPNRLVREHPISRSWFYELLARYRREGPAGLEPRTHRPARCPHQVDQAIVDVVLELRTDLLAAGLDAGPQTILHHLAGRFPKTPSRVTVWCILKRQGLIFVGIDVIGDWLTEINVTSPTGIRAVKNLGGPDAAALIWDKIETKRKASA